MRTETAYRFVHNRKNETGKTLLQVEIRFITGERKFVSTGIYLEPKQWDGRIRNTGVDNKLSKKAQSVIDKLQAAETKQGSPLRPYQVDKIMKGDQSTDLSFTDWMTKIINKRSDLADGTIYLHRRAVKYLKESGIELFSDLTPDNILKFHDYLKENTSIDTQTSFYKIHQTVGEYIELAIEPHELLVKNPYNKLRKNQIYKKMFGKGKSAMRNPLDDSEIDLLRKFKSGNYTIQQVADMAAFQSWTGIQHRDMMEVTYSGNYRNNTSGNILDGMRMKSDEYYFIPILPEADNILKRYKDSSDRLFPPMSLKTYNEYLKIVADGAGIKRNLTSYVLRHTAATWMIRNGIPITVVQKILGHAQIETTMIYAKTEKSVILKELEKLR